MYSFCNFFSIAFACSYNLMFLQSLIVNQSRTDTFEFKKYFFFWFLIFRLIKLFLFDGWELCWEFLINNFRNIKKWLIRKITRSLIWVCHLHGETLKWIRIVCTVVISWLKWKGIFLYMESHLNYKKDIIPN